MALDQNWHLDKKVSISLILVVLVQAISLVVFFVRMDNRINNLEKWKIETSANRFTISDGALHEYKINQNREDVIKIYTKLDQMQEDISAIRVAVGAGKPPFGG